MGKIFNTFENYDEIFKKKKSLDYVMSSIVGIKGLNPTYNEGDSLFNNSGYFC